MHVIVSLPSVSLSYVLCHVKMICICCSVLCNYRYVVCVISIVFIIFIKKFVNDKLKAYVEVIIAEKIETKQGKHNCIFIDFDKGLTVDNISRSGVEE